MNIVEQKAPLATTLTDIYTVPVGKRATIASIIACNRSASPTSFRVSIAKGGAADAVQQYIYYNLPIPGNDTFIATIGVTLNVGDVVRVYATLATLSFNLSGIEKDA